MTTKIAINTIVYNALSDNGNSVFRNSETIGYIFKNSGNSPVQLNNYTLFPGEVFKTFECNLFDTTHWNMQWNIGNVTYPTCGNTNGELTCLIYAIDK
jgi:hypothetical protein